MGYKTVTLNISCKNKLCTIAHWGITCNFWRVKVLRGHNHHQWLMWNEIHSRHLQPSEIATMKIITFVFKCWRIRTGGRSQNTKKKEGKRSLEKKIDTENKIFGHDRKFCFLCRVFFFLFQMDVYLTFFLFCFQVCKLV